MISPRLQRIFFVSSFLIFPFFILYPYLTGAISVGGADWEDLYLPWQQFFTHQIQSGHYPFWNPYALLGMPIWGNAENALFYPPKWMLLWRPEYMVSIFLWIHFVWAHYGGWRAGRALGMSSTAAWVAGFSFSYNGWMCSHLWANHTLILAVISWIPHLLATALSYSRNHSWGGWTFRLFIEGVMLTQAGAPQNAYYGIIFVGLVIICLRTNFLCDSKFLVGAILAGICSILVALPQGLGAAMMHAESARSGDYPWERAIWFSLLPYQWRHFLFGPSPEFISKRTVEAYETGVFVGPFIVGLAIASFRGRRRYVMGLLAISFLFFSLSLVKPAIVLEMFRRLPGAGSFRTPGRFIICALAPIALMAGLGWDVLSTQFRKRLHPSLVRIVGVAILAVIVITYGIHMHRYKPDTSDRHEDLRARLATFAKIASGDDHPRVFLGEGPLRPNQFWENEVEMVAGRGSPLISWRYVNYVSGPVERPYWIEIYPSMEAKPNSSLSLAAAPLYFTTKSTVDPTLRKIGRVDPYDIYRDSSAVSKVRFYPVGTPVKSREEARSFVWLGRNAVEELWYEGPAVPGLSPKTQGQCTSRQPNTDTWEIRCHSDGPGFVWISQSHYPDWRAYIMNQTVPIFPAHLLFQTVAIPAGDTTVVLRYEPRHLTLTLTLAAISMALMIGIGISSRRRI